MTTSPTFTYNRDQIIRRSLRQCNAIAAGETPGAQEVSDAADALNAMVSEWQASGLHLWKEKEATLFINPGQISYGLGAGATTNACSTPLLNQTSVTGNGLSAGSNTIPVASAAGMVIGDFFGVMLSSNALYWSTVSGISGLNITIARAIPAGASISPGVPVFDYATAIVRPLRVLNCRRILWSSMIETQLTQLSRLDFRELPNKTQQGIINQWFYDPQLTLGQFWTWLQENDSLNGIRMTWMEPISNFNTAADYPDFPVEWINCLVWNLSNEIGAEYQIPDNLAARIAQRAAETKEVVMGFDREPESFYLGVNFDQTSR